ncbi:hypothetical protein PIB30_085383 [Stylosanthes scabra]|uniref:Uncharacterized protein n=1 Tax=Stylosanthes scabra TaxID=79078 RepID=A0ABU6ZRG1_9FABA|nr:hypothetical protein [Stylosanthes scabra]
MSSLNLTQVSSSTRPPCRSPTFHLFTHSQNFPFLSLQKTPQKMNRRFLGENTERDKPVFRSHSVLSGEVATAAGLDGGATRLNGDAELSGGYEAQRRWRVLLDSTTVTKLNRGGGFFPLLQSHLPLSSKYLTFSSTSIFFRF